jgi:putative transposase
MKFYTGEIYHVYNRGNIKQKVFYERKNYLFFLRKMETHLKPYCHILAWCLMPNHFHWLVKVKQHNEWDSSPSLRYHSLTNESHLQLQHIIQGKDTSTPVNELNKSIGVMLRSYTRALNIAYRNRGSIFQQKTKSKNLNAVPTIRDNYAVTCFLYIMQNPVRAGLVSDFKHWEFSSYQDYSGLRNGKLCNRKLAIELFDLPESNAEFKKFMKQALPGDYQEYIF